jgi:hypothetical protein
MSSPQPPSDQDRSRRKAFIALLAVCLLVGGGFVAWAAVRDDDGDVGEAVTLGTGDATGPTADGSAGDGDTLPPSGIVFQNVRRDAAYAHMTLLPPDAKGKRTVTKLVCERAHFAAGRGLCLLGKQGVTGIKFDAQVVDKTLDVLHEQTLTGILSRARVSPDGRYGATTAFVAGHSYADVGKFSTNTNFIDMASGKKLADLEDFDVTNDGKVVSDVDRNYWGITFARDSDRFYATLGTRKSTWLIEGSVSGRTAHTLHENVECPSLSPDGKRIAYKKRVRDQGDVWRLYVLDLATMKETATSEPRSIDDQAEWLDDDTILYGLDADVWAVKADGSGKPVKYVPDALSPAVLRG